MKLNFFEKSCQEPPISDQIFGLCDDENGKKAYLNKDDSNKWIAEIRNDRKKALIFSAIDKCILQDNELEDFGRCDAMIFSEEHLYFIELKNQNKKWTQDAIKQLEDTIVLFRLNHDIEGYKHKKAFACNKQRKPFRVISHEISIRFFRKHKFRLDIQTNVVVA